MGFGLYGDRGTLDCARHPGAKGHEAQDGAWLGAHKIDWYKEDACYATGDQATALAQYGEQWRMSNRVSQKSLSLITSV
eukprot:SAG31_NODE_2117_length_6412_cov_7.762712_3_plen_79_part_00